MRLVFRNLIGAAVVVAIILFLSALSPKAEHKPLPISSVPATFCQDLWYRGGFVVSVVQTETAGAGLYEVKCSGMGGLNGYVP